MKWLATFLLLLLIGAAVALELRQDPGYILMGYGPWTVEMSLALFVLLLLATFVALYFSLRLWITVLNVPQLIRDWYQRRNWNKASVALADGLVAHAEGDWGKAEKTLIAHARISQTPVLNYLAAARAAHAQGADDRRDRYLQLAQESAPRADIAVELTQAELQVEKGQYEQALATLQHLRQLAPKHVYVLKLLVRLYRQHQDWEEVLQLLPVLRSRQVLTADELRQLERSAYVHLLTQAARDKDPVKVQNLWARVPKALRWDEKVLSVYASQMLALNEGALVEPLLRTALERRWSDHLVYLYGMIVEPNSARRLAHAEGWLKDRTRNAALLLTLGRLCMRQRLWGKARAYLEASVANGALAESYHTLAQLLEQMGEGDRSVQYYHRGLELAAQQDARDCLNYGREQDENVPVRTVALSA